MKNLILKSLILISIIGFTSCKKEPSEPATPQTQVFQGTSDISNLFNVNWVLNSGNFYYETPTVYYNHPSVSYLNPFYGGACSFDTIKNQITTWRFTQTQFFLNGIGEDVATNQGGSYSLPTNVGGYTTVGIYNGSNILSRPIEIVSVSTSRLEVRVGEIGTIVGNPYSVLVFTNNGMTVTNPLPTVPYGYQYQGVLAVGQSGGSTQTSSLYNTRWIINKYSNGLVYTNPTVPDTLTFLNDGTYKINSSTNSSRTYSITTVVGSVYMNLNLNNCYSIGGSSYTISVSNTFVSDGVINGAQYNDNFGNNNTNKLIWMTRI